jgi:hypothetical protein
MGPATLTLTEFLLARIAEDETWVVGDGGQNMDDCQECGFANQRASSPYSRSRILADSVVKRQIVEELSDRFPRRRVDPVVTGHFLRLLAWPYTHHPDYRDDWRP